MAANLTLVGAAVAADGKTLTATINGGTGVGYAITDKTGLIPHLSLGLGWGFPIAAVAVLANVLTITLDIPVGVGEVFKLDIGAGSNLVDSAGNTPTGQNNIAVANGSAVTVRQLHWLNDKAGLELMLHTNLIDNAGVYASVRGGSWGTVADAPIEFVAHCTEMATLGYQGASHSVSVDGGAMTALAAGDAFWTARKATPAPLAAGKHLFRLTFADYMTGARIWGGNRTLHTVPTTKVTAVNNTLVGSQIPQATPVALSGAWTRQNQSMVDNAGSVNTGSFAGMLAEFAFVGSGVECGGITGTGWSVSVDGASPGRLVSDEGGIPGNWQETYAIAKGKPAGPHTFWGFCVGAGNGWVKGFRIINGTASTGAKVIGDNSMVVGSTATLAVDDWCRIGDGGNREWRQIQSIVGTTVTFTAAFAKDHAAGTTVTSYSAPAGEISAFTRKVYTRKVLGIGDSNTQGANDLGFADLPDATGTYFGWYDPRTTGFWKACQRLGWDFIDLGIQGTTAAQMIDTAKGAVGAVVGSPDVNYGLHGDDGKFDLVTVWPGTNDINSNVSTPAEYKASVQTIITTIAPKLRPNGRIILLEPHTPTFASPKGLSTAVISGIMDELVAENPLVCVHLPHVFDALVGGDLNGVHYRQSGQDKIGAALLEAIGPPQLHVITGPGAETSLGLPPLLGAP